jgi:predicted CopG family antitoxin
MASKTIMITESAYQRLKAARREGESFTEVIERLVGGRAPRLADFATLFDRKTAGEIAASVEALRAEEVAFERAKLKRGRGAVGRNP